MLEQKQARHHSQYQVRVESTPAGIDRVALECIYAGGLKCYDGIGVQYIVQQFVLVLGYPYSLNKGMR